MGFLGCLGSVELWGKREQRAAAEAIDTVDHHHWLVAQIQGRPRLEKPPLPRWSIAALMILTGRRDEWIIRLPGALAGVATVALIFALGRRMAGRSLGLASAFVLCSMGFFVGEMRQASNDCLLALFMTLALYAAYRRLTTMNGQFDPVRRDAGTDRRRLASGTWCSTLALGLGFLTKGPDHLVAGRRDDRSLPGVCAAFDVGVCASLCDGWGLLIFASLGPGLAGRGPC